MKCGYAVVSADSRRHYLEVVPTDRLAARMEPDVLAGITMACVGNATTSESVVRMLHAAWPALPIAIVDERNTTLEARRRYYEDHPPRGLLRLVPRGLLVPKEPLDGYAALLIVERYLTGLAGEGKA